MTFKQVYKLLSLRKFRLFSFDELCLFFPEEKRENVKKYVFRWKKNGWISPLRKGVYELTYPVDSVLSDLYVANKIYAPSYVSLETALSSQGIIPEVSMAVVSVTSKPTRRFKNRHGLFIYRSVQAKSFCGYHIEKQNGFDVAVAEPEKALVDYLYFKTLRGGNFDFDSERLDRKRIRRLNRTKLNRYAALYGLDLKRILYAHL
jgi:predicted transcriptional regulator of viral defense system